MRESVLGANRTLAVTVPNPRHPPPYACRISCRKAATVAGSTLRSMKARRYSANGVGETTQFGPSPDANRRVVVAVSP